MQKNRRITIKDIAREAGVSIGTVDRVLHRRGEVAAATRDKILRLSEEMNYTPNLMARALTSKHECSVAVLLPKADDEDIYWAAHYEGISKQAQLLENYSFKATIYHFDLQSSEEFRLQAQTIVEQQPDGVIFAPIFKKESEEFAAQLDALNTPYIFIDTYVDETNSIGFVGEDAFQSGRVAASIIDFGLPQDRDILLVNLSKDLANAQHLNSRNQGFLSYFMDEGRNMGMRISLEIPTTDYTTVHQRLTQVLSSNTNIGAIWVSGSKTHIVARVLESMNRRDVILVGYDVYADNTDFLRRNYIKFLIAQQPKEQGMKAVQSMFSYLVEHLQPVKYEYQKVEIVNSENIRFFI